MEPSTTHSKYECSTPVKPRTKVRYGWHWTDHVSAWSSYPPDFKRNPCLSSHCFPAEGVMIQLDSYAKDNSGKNFSWKFSVQVHDSMDIHKSYPWKNPDGLGWQMAGGWSLFNFEAPTLLSAKRKARALATDLIVKVRLDAVRVLRELEAKLSGHSAIDMLTNEHYFAPHEKGGK